MPWNENDNNSGNGNNNFKNKNNNNQSGPPDLDELFKKAKKWLFDNLNGKKSNPFSDSNNSTNSNKNNNDNGKNTNKFKTDNFDFQQQGKLFLSFFAIILVILFGIIGFYKVEAGEEAVTYRFGKYIGMTGPGPHWLLPVIYDKEIVNTSVVHQKNFEEDLITKDVDLVTVAVAVQYKIDNLENYLFKIRSAEESLSEATKSAIRQVVAESTLEQVLATGGMGEQIKNIVEQNLKYYQAGLSVLGVEILSVLPPPQVKEAFNDAIQAQEDEIRYQNEAEAYERKVVPVAEGNAARILQDANSYVAQTVLAAQANVAKFDALLPEYTKAPQVTRNRLYIGAMENTLKNTPKILVDSKSSNILYLPLDKMNLDSTLKNVAKLAVNSDSQTMIDNADNSMNSMNSKQAGNNDNNLDTNSRPHNKNTEIRTWRN